MFQHTVGQLLLQYTLLLLQHLSSDTQSLSLPMSSLSLQFLCPEEWRDLSLPSAHTSVLPEVSFLNFTLQGTAASFRQILSEPPSVECCSTQCLFKYVLIPRGFLNDALKNHTKYRNNR